MTNIVNIANACINLSYWPTHFKRSLSNIIPKPNKSLYDSPKSFQPIVLLNTIDELIEKVISNKIQVHAISSNFLYPNQLGDIRQCSTTDAGVYLTYVICADWIKELHTSTLAFNIAQFFPSLNHHLILLILTKASFDNRISQFFSNYLVNRYTQYIWNHFTSLVFNTDVGVGQGSALSLILSALYVAPLFHIFQKRIINLSIPVSLLSFIDDSLFVS